MSATYVRPLAILVFLSSSLRNDVIAQFQQGGLPGLSSPGVSESRDGYDVAGTVMSVTPKLVIVNIGGGKTFNVLINGATKLSVNGRATCDYLFPGAKVQVSGHLSRDPRVIHDAGMTLFMATADPKSSSSGIAQKRDPSWLQFTGTVVSVSPLVVQANPSTTLSIRSLDNGNQIPLNSARFEIQLTGGEQATISVDFGKSVEFAGQSPTVRSFVHKNGAASHVTITRANPLVANGSGRDTIKAQKQEANPEAVPKDEENKKPPLKMDRKNVVARERFKSTVLRQWSVRKDGNFLLALEESGPGGLDIHFLVVDGSEAAADELANFMLAGGPATRTYQLLAWFPKDERGDRLAKAHRSNLERFISLRLKDSVFDRSACYSDLDSSSLKSINQGVAEGTCVIYWPFR